MLYSQIDAKQHKYNFDLVQIQAFTDININTIKLQRYKIDTNETGSPQLMSIMLRTFLKAIY